MQTKVEGLVLSKVPFKERDIIASLLLRSGKTISILFPGGSGGGKHKKSSIIELGHMLKVELRHSRGELYGAKEWQIAWKGDQIRLNHRAFFLTCFFLETMKSISFDENLKDESSRFDGDSLGNFRVLSNALFHLECSLKQGDFEFDRFLPFFLSKLLQEHGLFPVLNECIHCGREITVKSMVQLVSAHGGFGCDQCGIQGSGGELFRFLAGAAHTPYQEYSSLNPLSRESIEHLMSYFNYNLQLNLHSFKSYQMLF